MNSFYFTQAVPVPDRTGQQHQMAIPPSTETTQQSLSSTGLQLPFNDGRRWVDLSQIIRLEGVSNYTHCYFTDAPPLLVALSLKVLAGRLPKGAIVRPHRKHLLNPAYIEAISWGCSEVLLTTGERVPIARRRVTGFRRECRVASLSLTIHL